MNDFRYQRRYQGKLQAILLDWAGTTMDYGCYAPAVVFIEVFKRQGVEITIEDKVLILSGKRKFDSDEVRSFSELATLLLALALLAKLVEELLLLLMEEALFERLSPILE